MQDVSIHSVLLEEVRALSKKKRDKDSGAKAPAAAPTVEPRSVDVAPAAAAEAAPPANQPTKRRRRMVA